MIRKTGFAVITSLVYGLVEAILLGYSIAILFFLILLFTVSADITMFNLYQAKALKELSVKREVGKSFTRKGEYVDVVLVFANNSNKIQTFSYYDTLSTVFKTRGAVQGELALGPGQAASRSYSLAATAIGRYEVGPIMVFSDDPLHLVMATMVLAPNNELRVAPSASDLFHRRAERASNLRFTSGMHISKRVGQGYNFYGVREYADTDDFRHVAWSRYGIQNGEDLYIKQMEDERQVDVIFVMDYSYSVNQGAPEHLLFDKLVSDVIAMSHSILKNHDGVGYMLTSSIHDVFIKPEKKVSVVDKLGRAVSEVRPEGVFDVQVALRRIKDEIRKEAIIFVITPFSFSESFRMQKKSAIQIGKRINMVIVKKGTFMPEVKEKVDAELIGKIVDRENISLKRISHFFNSIGIRTYVAAERNFIPYVMGEYAYGKVTQ